MDTSSDRADVCDWSGVFYVMLEALLEPSSVEMARPMLSLEKIRERYLGSLSFDPAWKRCEGCSEWCTFRLVLPS